MVSGVDNYLTMQNRVRALQKAHESAQRSEDQITSRVKHRHFHEIIEEKGGGVVEVSKIYGDLSRINMYHHNNLTARDRFQKVSTALSNVASRLLEFQSTLIQFNSGGRPNIDLKRAADNVMVDLVQEMKVKDETGRYLLSGTNTEFSPFIKKETRKESAPVDFDILQKTNVIKDRPTAIYYGGSHSYFPFRVADGQTVKLEITAAHPGFVEAIGGLNYAKNSYFKDPTTGEVRYDQKALDKASQYLMSAQQKLRQVTDSINENMRQIEMKMIIGEERKAVTNKHLVDHMAVRDEESQLNVIQQNNAMQAMVDVIARSERTSEKLRSALGGG